MNLGLNRLPTVEEETNSVTPKINCNKYDAVKQIWSNWSILSFIHFWKAKAMYFQKKKKEKKSLIGKIHFSTS